MKGTLRKYYLPFAVFIFTFIILGILQVKLSRPINLLERFIQNAGWIEIVVVASYGAFVTYKMQNPLNVPKWRRITWTLFSIVFFSQLLIGLLGADRFLMTGKLHLPIPLMILAGPLYRYELGFMTILFLSTLALTGPAWCSQLCYFGAFDRVASQGKTKNTKFKYKYAIKSTLVLLVIFTSLMLRWFNVPGTTAAIAGLTFGIVGILIMVFYSHQHKKMIHCVLYCPIGTVVNVLKYLNPFRMKIDTTCNLCMKCCSFCKYDALNPEHVRNKKPGFTCTLCGDCLAACRDQSIKYHYFNMNPEAARKLYLFFTISMHAIFMALARM